MRSKTPWIFGIAGLLFAAASCFDFLQPWIHRGANERHHYLRASIDLLLGLYCGIIALRIRAKERRMLHLG